MTNLQSILGGTLWAATAALLLCAALEPIHMPEPGAPQSQQVASAAPVAAATART